MFRFINSFIYEFKSLDDLDLNCNAGRLSDA